MISPDALRLGFDCNTTSLPDESHPTVTDTGHMTRFLVFSLGVFSLLLGVLIYHLGREHLPPALAFVSSYLHFIPKMESVRHVSFHAPDFLHPFGMTLICTSLLASTKRTCYLIGMLWFSLNSFFEVLQAIPKENETLIQVCRFLDPVGAHVYSYIVWGTFDFLDLAMTLVGAALGTMISLHLLSWRGKCVQ